MFANSRSNPDRLSRRAMLTGAVAAGAGVCLSLPYRSAQASAPVTLPARHHAARAKHVILLYMSGGYSHVDSFDPKPELLAKHDQTIKEGVGPQAVDRYLKAPLWTFRPNSICGTEVSDLFPHIRGIMHKAALIRSMQTDHRDHGEATLQLHTGSTNIAMPSLGAWLSYGLGTENSRLPAHVVISEHRPYNGAQIWDANFLPAVHTGVRITPGPEPLPYLRSSLPEDLQAKELELLRVLNQHHLEQRAGQPRLEGRLRSFETAQGLQELAPKVLDISQESAQTLELYGVDPGQSTSYASQCLMARRLVESGVRFVEIIDSVGACRDNWDAAHRDVLSHEVYAKRVDRPIAALICDLKQRGLLDEVLVVFCTEFGRTPWAQDGKGSKGRSHHPHAFSCWLAGGGVRPGIVHGSSDDIGNLVDSDAVHVHDFHATILHLLGLDHERLTYRHAGRDFRLTDVFGHVVQNVIA